MTFVWSFTNSVTQVGDKYLRTKLYVLKLFPAQRQKVLSSSEVESTFQLRGGKYFPPQRRKVLSTSEAESDSIQTWKQIQYIKSRILDVDRRSFNVDRRNEALRNSLERGLAYKKYNSSRFHETWGNKIPPGFVANLGQESKFPLGWGYLTNHENKYFHT